MEEIKEETAREPLPSVVTGEGQFQFPNGDKYVGGFEARKINFTVIKQGYGEYTTWDGHIYRGQWTNDLLDPNEEQTIEYCDRSKYEGYMANGKYCGMGTYTFPDQSSMHCLFTDNMPDDDVTFLDKQGFTWIGGVRGNNLKLRKVNRLFTTCVKKKLELVEEDEELMIEESDEIIM